MQQDLTMEFIFLNKITENSACSYLSDANVKRSQLFASSGYWLIIGSKTLKVVCFSISDL